MKGRATRYLILGCCVVVRSYSSLSLRSHYTTSATDYCDLNTTFNCDLVNRSTFSKLEGVPVALIGLLGYVFLFVMSAQTKRSFSVFRFATAAVGLAFALYLAYIEAYVLAVWCLLCIGSLAMITAITTLTGIAAWRTLKTEPEPNAGN